MVITRIPLMTFLTGVALLGGCSQMVEDGGEASSADLNVRDSTRAVTDPCEQLELDSFSFWATDGDRGAIKPQPGEIQLHSRNGSKAPFTVNPSSVSTACYGTGNVLREAHGSAWKDLPDGCSFGLAVDTSHLCTCGPRGCTQLSRAPSDFHAK